MKRARLAHLAGGLLALTLLAGACNDGNDDADDGGAVSEPGGGTETPARPEVTFSAGGFNLDVPAEVPSGFVDIRVQSIEGEADGAAHLLLARINDDVTDEEFDAAMSNDEDLFQYAEVVGGNGTITAGDRTALTLELAEGRYVAINIFFPDPTGGPQFAFDRFAVVDQGNEAEAPDDEGTIDVGPEMRITVPEGFDATGVWRFENLDQELVHEAAAVRLAPGATAETLVQWFHTMEGPPPILGEFGSMGAIGPGNEGWIDFDASPLEAGDYALVCFIPGDDGIPHVAQGMIAGFTVSGSGT
jgi:hypothetical protein